MAASTWRLLLGGELPAPADEGLDAVPLGGVVARAHRHAEVEPLPDDPPGDDRRGDDPEVLDVRSRGGEGRGEAPGDLLPAGRGSRPTATRTGPPSAPAGAQDAHQRRRQRARVPGASAPCPARSRIPSVPKSAMRPCGGSGGPYTPSPRRAADGDQGQGPSRGRGRNGDRTEAPARERPRPAGGPRMGDSAFGARARHAHRRLRHQRTGGRGGAPPPGRPARHCGRWGKARRGAEESSRPGRPPARQGLAPGDLRAVVADVGPGSFTGRGSA